jgi:hypothetical protein
MLENQHFSQEMPDFMANRRLAHRIIAGFSKQESPGLQCAGAFSTVSRVSIECRTAFISGVFGQGP